MQFTKFVRKPFIVEAVRITKENIEEIAEMMGSLRKKENGEPFILVDERLVPSIERVYIGFWMTKMEGNIRCYSNRIFQDQFAEITPESEALMENIGGQKVANGG